MIGFANGTTMILKTMATDAALSGVTYMTSEMLADVGLPPAVAAVMTQMKIEASKGAQALDISPISQYTTEAEILFDAGQEMLIASAEVKDGILYITAILE